MKRIAILGDIHANLPALERVLAHAGTASIDEVWNTGDSVGYGPFPNPVVEIIQSQTPPILSIQGNFDREVVEYPESPETWRQKQPAEKRLAYHHAHHALTRANRSYLDALPQEIRLQAQGYRILIVHGSPASNEEHLYPDTPESRLRELAQMAAADVVICGHSHRAFVRRVAGVWFVNTGSVGRADDGDPRTCYGLLTFERNSFHARHYRLAYDVERVVRAVRAQGLPEAFAKMFIQGRGLDAVR